MQCNWFDLLEVLGVVQLPSTAGGLLKRGSAVLKLILVLPLTEVEDVAKLLDHVLVHQRFFKATSQHVINMYANHADNALSAKAFGGVRGSDVREVSFANQEGTGIQDVRS